MHNVATSTIDLSKVRAVVYHMPDGESFSVPIESFDQFYELGLGKICDTSDVDGNVHFFPRGNA